MTTDLSGADVAAAMGRDLPALIRLDRSPRQRSIPLGPDKQRALDLIAGPAARRRLDALRDRLVARTDTDALRSDLDAIAGDTGRAHGPGGRDSCG